MLPKYRVSQSIATATGAIIAGIVLGYSIAYGGWLLGILSLSAGMSLLLRAQTALQRLCIGFLCTTAKMLVVLSWGFNMYPLSWIGDISGPAVMGLILLYWVLASSVVGFVTGIACALWRPGNHLLWTGVTLSIALGVSESLSAGAYALIFSGAGSTLQSYFSFGFVGYVLAGNSHLLAWAQVGGVYALSLLMYISALMVAVGWQTSTRRLVAIGVVAVVVLVPFGMPLQYESSGRTITTIDTTFPTLLGGFAPKRVALEAAIQTALAAGAATIVLPEDSRFVRNSFTTPEVAQRWWQAQFAASTSAQLYDSGRAANQAGETVLRGYVLHTSGSQPAHFDKSYLVPQGEFLPYFADVGLSLFTTPATQDRLRAHMSYRPSFETQYPAEQTLAPFLFCFEAVNPLGVKNAQTRQTHPFVVHPVSHGWFAKTSDSLRHQLTAMLTTQAVWQQVPIVVAGNEFTGFTVLPDGSLQTGTVLADGEYWRIKNFTI